MRIEHLTTQDERPPVSSAGSRTMLHLVWQHGAAVPPASLLNGGVLVAGRESGCNIRLDSTVVSRRHAEFCSESERVMVRDLGSRNGVYVNAQRLESPCALRHGDVVRLGDCVGVVVSAPHQIRDWALEDLGCGLMAGPELSVHLEIARRLAKSDLSVSIVGATGSGKERVASLVHAWSGRPGPLCPVNCAALPANLVEAELFGYRKGAFTGAACPHLGHFRQANGGTLFLDEIADLSLDVQAKLLRVVEQKTVQPIGDSRSYDIDVRILVASQVSLDRLVAQGKFREDLARRLSGAAVELPPLKERRSEIVPLFRHFIQQHLAPRPQFDPRLVEALLLYHWPGNIRQLELLVRRLALVHGSAALWSTAVLNSDIRSATARPIHAASDHLGNVRAERAEKEQTRRASELDELRTALAQMEGNVRAAAAHAGISRQRAYRLLQAEQRERPTTVATSLRQAGEAPGDALGGK